MDTGSVLSSVSRQDSGPAPKSFFGKTDNAPQPKALDKLLQEKTDEAAKTGGDALSQQFRAIRIKEIKRQLAFFSILSGNPLNSKIVNGAYTAIESDIKNLVKATKEGTASSKFPLSNYTQGAWINLLF